MITVGSLFQGEWWTAATFAFLSYYGIREWCKERKRRRALAEWPRERVTSVVSECDDLLDAARRLREIDHRLDLLSSLELVTRTEGGAGDA
ncbi:hypothetical protein [Gordonia oryzae]|uniref:hypothetical protein n=1 Tax=Gordonia oryzae TaxID=2487349 RepID=UPI000F4E9250|nr:hypothetical protein [Gordonia oryzae]